MSLFSDRTVRVEYYFKRLRPEVYQVAKFVGTKLPVAVYTIRRMRHCDCTGGRRWGNCHHVKDLHAWINAGRPWPRAFDFYDGRTYSDKEQDPYAREET